MPQSPEGAGHTPSGRYRSGPADAHPQGMALDRNPQLPWDHTPSSAPHVPQAGPALSAAPAPGQTHGAPTLDPRAFDACRREDPGHEIPHKGPRHAITCSQLTVGPAHSTHRTPLITLGAGLPEVTCGPMRLWATSEPSVRKTAPRHVAEKKRAIAHTPYCGQCRGGWHAVKLRSCRESSATS